jgi:hypothetical protein
MINLFRALFFGVTLVFAEHEQLLGAQVEQITLQEKMAPHTNPTSHEFDASISEMKSAIEKACGDKWQEEQVKTNQGRVWKGGGSSRAKHSLTQALQLSGADLLWKGDADALANNLLTKPGNEDDAYLYGGTSPVGESLTYFKDGQPLIYFADFHIHLVAIPPHKTRVDIFTYNSSVVAGVDESWSPHGPSFIFVKVPPTTIEQYQILIRIGEALGVKDMPPLVKPLPDGPINEIKLPRER